MNKATRAEHRSKEAAAIETGVVADLTHEAEGILAWLVRGCLLWQREGLELPAAVSAATSEYEEDSDLLADFLEAMCVEVPGAEIGARAFYRLYAQWATDAELTPRERLSSTGFGRVASGRFIKARRKTGAVYCGVRERLLEDETA